ncbi:MAG TPA: hypothetical protein VLZ74_03120 [Methylocella sp.]|nr:hypothetical protein [Methylocella sp.]
MTWLIRAIAAQLFTMLMVGFPQGAIAATLDLCGLKPTFTEDFHELKVSSGKWTTIAGSRTRLGQEISEMRHSPIRSRIFRSP